MVIPHIQTIQQHAKTAAERGESVEANPYSYYEIEAHAAWLYAYFGHQLSNSVKHD
tara:strand:+ start:15121 stop:15288 length:168 start_codon:yes stop_codon:yes gene_type:complete